MVAHDDLLEVGRVHLEGQHGRERKGSTVRERVMDLLCGPPQALGAGDQLDVALGDLPRERDRLRGLLDAHVPAVEHHVGQGDATVHVLEHLVNDVLGHVLDEPGLGHVLDLLEQLVRRPLEEPPKEALGEVGFAEVLSIEFGQVAGHGVELGRNGAHYGLAQAIPVSGANLEGPFGALVLAQLYVGRVGDARWDLGQPPRRVHLVGHLGARAAEPDEGDREQDRPGHEGPVENEAADASLGLCDAPNHASDS